MGDGELGLGLIFRMDWLDLLAVQGTLKSLLHAINAYLAEKPPLHCRVIIVCRPLDQRLSDA